MSTLLIQAEIRNGGDYDKSTDHCGPQHEPPGRIPFERDLAPVRCRSSKQCRIAKPPGPERNDGDRHEKRGGNNRDRRCRNCRRNQPSQVIPTKRGDEDRQRREVKQKGSGDRPRYNGRKHERRSRARSQSDQHNLYHLQLSRLISG